MNVREYRIKHPGAATASDSFLKKQSEDKIRQYSTGLREKVGKRTFDFIGDSELKKILQRDLKSAKTCLTQKLWKPCIFLYAAIIEAILKEMHPAKDKNGIKFKKVIDWAKEQKAITESDYHKVHVIRNLRNYIHIHLELKDKPEIDENWAKVFARVCESVIKHFKK